jgi:hypothetical protein
MMKRTFASLVVFTLWLATATLNAGVLPGQSTVLLSISPSAVTIVVGESQAFRLVDSNGNMQQNVTWEFSDPSAFQIRNGDELAVIAKVPGDYKLRAHAANGGADAVVKVISAKEVTRDMSKWSADDLPGCKTTKVTQAPPSATGIDVYAESQCEDGAYISAYSNGGVMLWRKKADGTTAAPMEGAPAALAAPAVTRPLSMHSASVCDGLEAGISQQKVRDLLRQRNVSFTTGSASEHMWIVEESSFQCRIWFDEKGLLIKKRKILVTE